MSLHEFTSILQEDNTRTMIRRLTMRTTAYAATGIMLLGLQVSGAAEIEAQRQLFIEVYPAVELGNWDVVERLPASDQELLQQYVLWPDLRATWFRANLATASPTDVDDFLDRFGTLRPARELRYKYALHLARSGAFDKYLEIYQQFYQGLDNATLDCFALQAELDAGRFKRVNGRALSLWMVGTSQVSECDPVFDYLGAENLLGPEQYRERFALAIAAQESTLAKWLGKSIDQQHVDTASRWIRAQSNPEDFLEGAAGLDDDETTRAQLVYATERLTYRDPLIAAALWSDVAPDFAFSTEQVEDTLRHIALWMARDDLPGAYERLAALPQGAQDDEVMRWRARISLRDHQWLQLLGDIGAMSAAERDAEEWQYWRAVALARSGQILVAKAAYEKLSLERSYYGFLAADELDRAYALSESRLLPNEAVIADIETKPGIIRARELFFVGQDSRGRSEWDAVVQNLEDDEKLQAAIIADRWGWHSRAIATAASIDEYDDLDMRYPLPYLQQFEQFSLAASISPTWAYGIARSESLFMPDVRSRAGAVGLMQLMPATGREVAQEIKLPYAGLATLTDADSNIRLGTTYLGKMAMRYSGNRVLATAAYNAGPHRVDQWLPEQGSIDARVWIENIPFNETRSYVKRVLAAETIFQWRLTGIAERLSDTLPEVLAPTDLQRLAAR